LLLVAGLAWASAATAATAAPATASINPDDAGACTALQPSSATTGTARRQLLAPTIAPSRSSDPAGSATIDESTKVSPDQVDVRRALEPGDAFTCIVTIRNRHARAMTFTLEPIGVRGARDGGIAFIGFEDEAIASTAASWLDPAQSTITLKPRGVAKVPVTVTVPPKPPVGAAYAMLMVVPHTQARAAAPDSSLGIQGRVAVAFLLRVGGEGRPKLTLREAAAPRLRWNRASWTYRARLENTGTLHARPRVRVRVRSLFGATVSTLDVSGRTLLPGGSEPIATTWRGVPWIGFYRYDVRVASSGSGTATSPARSSGWFVALPPWWLSTIAVLALIGLVGGAAARRRHELHWRDYLDEE
jgi:hypothetical protein